MQPEEAPLLSRSKEVLERPGGSRREEAPLAAGTSMCYRHHHKERKKTEEFNAGTS